MANVLVLYYYLRYPPRATNLDHLYSLRRYSQHNVCYLNLSVNKGVPQYVQDFPWDLIVFHDLFVCSRWTRWLFEENVRKVESLKDHLAMKVVIPQDEFISMDLVCHLINDFKIKHVFSVSPESEWPKMYRDLQGDVRIHKVLTGYIDDHVKRKISWFALRQTHRPVDIGYRSHPVPFWLGRHAMLKWQLAEVFQKAVGNTGLVTDISAEESETITGDDWFKFLLGCKYQLGIEGGASILDWDGMLQVKTDEYLKDHPAAGFEEVEQACFPNMDGSLKLFALSPRHLECALTKTCQILVEGAYDGVLQPWRHYIPLKRDFSNVAEVLEIVKQDHLREGIVERVWKEIVVPGQYSYKKFAKDVIEKSLGEAQGQRLGAGIRARMEIIDWLSWKTVRAQYTLGRQKKWLENILARNR